MPETLDVKAMLPLAWAAMGRPEGESVTESVSTRSTYSSFEVWRTLARRQGTGEVVGEVPGGVRVGLREGRPKEVEGLRAGEEL